MEENAVVALNRGSMTIFTEDIEYDKVWYPPMVPPNTLCNFRTFEIREDDLILVTFPKSGTHWMIELLSLIKHDGQMEKLQRGKDPILNTDVIFRAAPDFKKSGADLLDTRPSPRFYRTHVPSKHLPLQVWTKKPKVVYVTRDPKDACASLYHFLNSNPAKGSDVPWEIVFSNYISEKAHFGNWSDHALGYWEHRNDGHVFFVTFEEMKQDIHAVARRLATFMGKTFSEKDLQKIIDCCSLESMKKTYNKLEEQYENGKIFTRSFGLMPYLQKGNSGGWKALFSEEQKEEMDKTMKGRLVGTGLDVHYPLPTHCM